ncbi:MAG TPA: nucleoside hydrolase, partial [Thermopolyspora sp.]
VLALGPLTNLALALRIDPDLLTGYRSVVLMGGSGPYPELGTSLMIDANVNNDPAAARAVFSAPRGELVMVGVNVTSATILTEHAIAALRAADTPRARFATEILDSYLDFYQNHWGRRVIPLHDPLAAGILLDPSFATAAVTGPVNVVTDGFLSRAHLMRTFDGLPPSFSYDPAPDTKVITAVDSARFVADFVETLSRS